MKRVAWSLAALLVLSAAVRADPPEGRTEISVLLGVSLLDAQQETSEPVPIVLRGRPIPLPEPLPFDFRHRRSLGGSFLQGFRVGRYLSDRAVAELAFSVAPSHHLRAESFFSCPPDQVCPLGDQGRSRSVPVFRDEENVAAYHYGVDFAYDLARGDVRPFLTFGVGGVSYDTVERVRTDFAFGFGAGAKLCFGKAGARLEVVDRLVPDHFLTGRAEHDVQVRGGFVFRLP